MFKRINLKVLLFTLLWLASLSGIVMLMSFIQTKKDIQLCTDVKIIVPGNASFVDRSDVIRIIESQAGVLRGKKLNVINTHQLENILKSNPYIKEAKVYSDLNGVVYFRLAQREPALRIFNLTNQDFYIDQDGFKIPSSMGFTPHVLVANGYIMEGFNNKADTLKTQVLKDLFTIAKFIDSDTLWSVQTEQLYVNQQKEIELIPRVGNHRIIVGNADSLETRFRNLLIFYKKVIPAVGWEAYKTINIKYYNQIVCERNKMDSTKLQPEAAASVVQN